MRAGSSVLPLCVLCMLCGQVLGEPVTAPATDGAAENPAIGGVFPLLCTPYSEDGSLDCGTLAKEAAFVADCGCPGTNVTDMLRRVSVAEAIASKHVGLKATMLVRIVDDGKCDADYERQYEALAAATKLPVIVQTYNGKSPMPSAKMLIGLAQRHPGTYGWFKVEGTGAGIVPCMRELVAAKPAVKTVFTGWGGRDWLYHYRRVGTRGVISQRPMYADLMADIWRALESGEDALADERFAKFIYLRNLDDVLPAANMRGWNLHVLKKRGVFRNTLSRVANEKGGWQVEDVDLDEGMKAEIEARLAYALDLSAR